MLTLAFDLDATTLETRPTILLVDTGNDLLDHPRNYLAGKVIGDLLTGSDLFTLRVDIEVSHHQVPAVRISIA
jgi:hypothetical protein